MFNLDILLDQVLLVVPFTFNWYTRFHVIIGLIWISGLIIRNATRGLSVYTAAKVNTAALYWHFIDVVWVFIFTIVYLLGVL